jgi:hypothetical protein
MQLAKLDTLIWVLIFGGLLVLSLGVFLQRGSATLGWVVTVAGALAAGAGVVLIVVRSRLRDPAGRGSK